MLSRAPYKGCRNMHLFSFPQPLLLLYYSLYILASNYACFFNLLRCILKSYCCLQAKPLVASSNLCLLNFSLINKNSANVDSMSSLLAFIAIAIIMTLPANFSLRRDVPYKIQVRQDSIALRVAVSCRRKEKLEELSREGWWFDGRRFPARPVLCVKGGGGMSML